MSGVLSYESNNSGGSWWLDDRHWHRLEDAGWIVHWIHDFDDPTHVHDEDERPLYGEHTHRYSDDHRLTKVAPSGERWLGALAMSAALPTDDPAAAVREWELVTGMDASAAGCNCCGEPHNFVFVAEDGTRHYSTVTVTSTSLDFS